MGYAFRYLSTNHVELVEITPAERRAANAHWEAYLQGPDDAPAPYPYTRPTDAATAHRWVKNGSIHSTALYLDHEGRIRAARG